jgi:hypothetical protein
MGHIYMSNYRVIIGNSNFSIEDETPVEAATKIIERVYKGISGNIEVPLVILVQDHQFDGLPNMEDKTNVLYSPEIFANAGLYDIAAKLKAAFESNFNV